ncbi:MAG: hypothetical protein PHY05_08095 [Methanothrix sp.]|nr:hypothetical protein [Methanothrix sp.]
MDTDKQTIRRVWSMVLEKKDCIEIYEYLNNIILNEENPLDRKFIVELLKMARASTLPCGSGAYGNLSKDIEHYIEVYSKDI